MLRYMCLGEMTAYILNLRALKPGATTESMGKLKVWLKEGEVTDMLLKEMVPLIQTASLGKGSLLYVPCGWFVIDHVLKGPLCYGLRKSMFFISSDQKAGYGVAKDMLAKDGHNVESMEKLSKLLIDKVES